jgi:hypothetical protein
MYLAMAERHAQARGYKTLRAELKHCETFNK